MSSDSEQLEKYFKLIKKIIDGIIFKYLTTTIKKKKVQLVVLK